VARTTAPRVSRVAAGCPAVRGGCAGVRRRRAAASRLTALRRAAETAAVSARAPRLYVVLTYVPRRTTVPVGALGPVVFARGWYAYVGSAARARRARVARHLAPLKPLRWHADYLFAVFPARCAWLVDGAAGECALAGALAALPGASRRPLRFGAGDCRCAGHLVRFARRPLRRDLAVAAQAARAGAHGAVRSFAPRASGS
jgi:Uri superfamily endonuclease